MNTVPTSRKPAHMNGFKEFVDLRILSVVRKDQELQLLHFLAPITLI
jgi:hypothetical protein